MTWEFKPGMKVVCVNDNFRKSSYPVVLPKLNDIYTIRSVHTWNEIVCIRLEEIKNQEFNYIGGKQENFFHSNMFRPLQTQFTSLLNSIVAGVNDGKLVVEDEKYMKRFKDRKGVRI